MTGAGPERCHSPTEAWCLDRPAQFCEQERLGAFPEAVEDHERYWEPLRDTYGRYSEACPDAEAISQLVSLGAILELGAGNGYWARLMRDRGGDVIAYDRRLRPQTWSDVLPGDESALSAHTDRTLLFVMPPRPNDFGRVLGGWRGTRFAIVTRSVFPFGIDDRNPDAFADEVDAIDEGGWVREWERDLLPHGPTRVIFSLWSSV